MKKLNRGLFKTHEYQSLRFAPTVDSDNKELDSVIKSFYSVINKQFMKSLRDGQPVVAIEIYGDHQKSFYLITIPKNHTHIIKERLASAYPGAGIKEYTHEGWPFTDNEQETLIAQLTLEKHPFFPIEMKEALSVTKNVLYTFDDLKPTEKLFLQILLEPVENGWQQELERAYESYLEGDIPETSGNFIRSSGKRLDDAITKWSMSFAKKEKTTAVKKHREIKELRQKLMQSGFHVNIRIVSKAKSYDRRNDLIESIASAFKTSNGYNYWTLAPVFRKKKMLTLIKERKMSLLSSPMLLCDDEIKTILRFPTKEIETRKLERMTPDEKKIDERITQNIIPMGKSIRFGEEGVPVGFSIKDNDTASKSRLFIAPPGSGKTTLAKIFAKGAMEVGHSGSIFDIADGSLYYGMIELTPPKLRDKLVLVNFADEIYPHIFNFNSLGRDADTVGEMFTEFFEVFFKTQSNHRMNSFLRKGSMTTFANPDATFLELILLMRDDEYRNKYLPTIRKTHPDLFLWWKTEFPKIAKSESQLTEILQPILYRLDELQYNKRLGPIFCGRGGRLNIYKWMNEGKWVLYNLSNGVFLENEQRMLMSFLNYAYWSATLAREKLLQRGIEPVVHHKIYDEPQTYMTSTPVTKLSISKSRKYRVSDNFFIQSPSQIIERDKELWTQILDMNPHIIIGGGLSNENLKIVSKEFGISEQELKQLEQLKYHWYMKTYVEKEALPPFIFDSSTKLVSYGRDKELENKWRNLLAPFTYQQIKEDINARLFKLTVDEYKKLLASYDEIEEEGVELG